MGLPCLTYILGDVDKFNPNPSRGMGSIRLCDQSKYSWNDLYTASSSITSS